MNYLERKQKEETEREMLRSMTARMLCPRPVRISLVSEEWRWGIKILKRDT